MLLVWLVIVSSPRHVFVKGFADRRRLFVKGVVKHRFPFFGGPGVLGGGVVRRRGGPGSDAGMTAITAPRGPSMPTATVAAVTIRGT